MNVFTRLLVLSWMLWISPQFSAQPLSSLTSETVEDWLKAKEAKVYDLKQDNDAKITWAAVPGIATEYAFVYLHGFGASRMEAQPVMSQLAEDFEANVFYARLKGHGRAGVEGFKDLTKETYIASAEQALKIGQLLGKKVILVSTSTGGTLSLYLASKYKDIAGLIMYSPFVGLKNPMMGQITTPKGREMFISMYGSEVQTLERPQEEARFWSTRYHMNAYIALIGMLKETMVPATFEEVSCPVFMGYYYKNEEEQDQVVSVAAMLNMFDQLSLPEDYKEKQSFPKAGNHVIASDLRSGDWSSVFEATQTFIKNIIIN